MNLLLLIITALLASAVAVFGAKPLGLAWRRVRLRKPGFHAARYLAAARSLGDALLVGVNSDASVRRLGKGPERPLMSEADRAELLTALRCVDAVVLFDDDTPLELVRALRPDVLAKGADYRLEEIVGAREVLEAGGRVERIPLVEGRSTTNLLSRLRAGGVPGTTPLP